MTKNRNISYSNSKRNIRFFHQVRKRFRQLVSYIRHTLFNTKLCIWRTRKFQRCNSSSHPSQIKIWTIRWSYECKCRSKSYIKISRYRLERTCRKSSYQKWTYNSTHTKNNNWQYRLYHNRDTKHLSWNTREYFGITPKYEPENNAKHRTYEKIAYICEQKI